MSTTAIDALQLKAREQRERLHQTASDLREKVHETREQLSLSRQAHEHLLGVSVAGGIVAFVFGYGVAGLFTRH